MADPLTAITAASTAVNQLGQTFGGGQGQEDPTSFFEMVKLLPPGEQETLLRELGVGGAQQAFDIAGGGEVGGLTQDDVARGRISPEMTQLIDRLAGDNFDELASRAVSAGAGRASLAGLPGSSVQSELVGAALAPLISERANLRANLRIGEIGRQQDLRSRILSDLNAAQSSPILSQLFQERLAQPMRTRLSTTDPIEAAGFAAAHNAGGGVEDIHAAGMRQRQSAFERHASTPFPVTGNVAGGIPMGPSLQQIKIMRERFGRR